MKTSPTTERSLEIAPDDKSRHRLARRLASQAVRSWNRGESPDARGALDQHPEFDWPSVIVMKLAYEEFSRRDLAGEALDPDEFAAKFPQVATTLRKLVGVHVDVSRRPELTAPKRPFERPEPGDTYLGFQLLAELGYGSFARVFLASEDELGGRPVVVKVCYCGKAEANMLGKLRHANIVPVYSVRFDPERSLTAICMPYLGMHTLCDVLGSLFAGGAVRVPHRGRALLAAVEARDDLTLSSGPHKGVDPFLEKCSYVDAVLHLGYQMAAALESSHAEGIVHRDLKPSNVLVTAEGRPMLLDFNLSIGPGDVDLGLAGTPPYMSPEHLRWALAERDSAEPDARSDVYSLGVILYQLLTGRLPFAPLSPKAHPVDQCNHMLAQQAEPAPALRQFNTDLDCAAESLVLRCLAADPALRPQSAAAVAAELRSLLARPRRLQRWCRVHPRTVAAAAVVVLGLAAGTMAIRKPEPPPVVIVAEPRTALEFFDRARHVAEKGQWASAMDDLQAAHRLFADARLLAYKGYCANRRKDHRSALLWYEKAMNSGLDSAAVRNNIGYAYLNLAEYEKAEVWLNSAIHLSPRFQPALHNRALLDICRWNPDAARVPVEALHCVRLALESGPPSGELYFHAAHLEAQCAKAAKSPNAIVATYVRQALNNGLSLVSLESDGLLKEFVDEARRNFQKTLNPQSFNAQRLVEPLNPQEMKQLRRELPHLDPAPAAPQSTASR